MKAKNYLSINVFTITNAGKADAVFSASSSIKKVGECNFPHVPLVLATPNR